MGTDSFAGPKRPGRPAPRVVRIRCGAFDWRIEESRANLLDKVGKWSYPDWIEGEGVRVIQEPTTRLAAVYRPEDSPPVFVKVSRFVRARKRIRSLYRPSDSHKEWEASLAAWRMGFPTPAPIGLGTRRKWGTIRETVYLTEYVEGSTTALSLFESTGQAGSPAVLAETRRRFIDRFGELVADLQEAGLIHRQLGPLNLLVRNGGGRNPRIRFTDNKHLEVRREATEEMKLENVVRTYYQWLAYLPGREMRNGDLLRFLRAYSGSGDSEELKRRFRRLSARILDRADRYRHRGMIPPGARPDPLRS